jgi:hypothetical protein
VTPMAQHSSIRKHVNEQAAAEFLDLSVQTLRDWRLHRTGPPYCKFGRSVRYPMDSLARFAEQARVEPVAA